MRRTPAVERGGCYSAARAVAVLGSKAVGDAKNFYVAQRNIMRIDI